MAYSDESEELALGRNVEIGEGARFAGGKIVIGEGSVIGRDAVIEATDQITIGKNSKIGDGAIIRGRRIELGREYYANHHAEIGGGSCFEKTSSLKIGYWFHQGSYSMINTAMPVSIGDEVGLGRFTNLYTHGAYLPAFEGFPVQFGPISIGGRVWIPSATVNPGVTIGNHVVIGVGSVVTHDIPSNCLALGTPCEVVRNQFPSRPPFDQIMRRLRQYFEQWHVAADIDYGQPTVRAGSATFNLEMRTIEGAASSDSERARTILRRLGIRFKFEVIGGTYAPWEE